MSENYFESFWIASELAESNAAMFAKQIAEFAPTQSLRTLTSSQPDVALPIARDALARLAKDRRSARSFSDQPIDLVELGHLLTAFSELNSRRMFPSAGGLYPLEIVCTTANVSGIDRAIWVYNFDNHSISKVAHLPDWSAWSEVLGSGVAEEPALCVFFLVSVDELMEKYGERGGRFALLEAGHAGQMFALHVAANPNVGAYAIGGVLDQPFLRLCGFDQLPKAPLVMLAYACGRMNKKQFDNVRVGTDNRWVRTLRLLGLKN
jgi:SagB-type dehydrogenase family enzyme